MPAAIAGAFWADESTNVFGSALYVMMFVGVPAWLIAAVVRRWLQPELRDWSIVVAEIATIAFVSFGIAERSWEWSFLVALVLMRLPRRPVAPQGLGGRMGQPRSGQRRF